MCDGRLKHAPNPFAEKNLFQLKSTAKETKCDFDVCFDGDADAMVVVNEQGKTVRNDLLTTLMAPYFLEQRSSATVVYDVLSSRVVSEEIINGDGTPRRERLGHTYMIKAMRDSHAIVGGDLSGHFYFQGNFYSDSRFIALMHLINVMNTSEASLSGRISPLKRYCASGELN